jgi:hypothetical protein
MVTKEEEDEEEYGRPADARLSRLKRLRPIKRKIQLLEPRLDQGYSEKPRHYEQKRGN